VTNPQPFVCRGGPGFHWYVTISGSLNGQPIHESFTTCWTLQMPTLREFGLTWEVLRNHLVPRRHKTIRPETRVRFAPGVLRPADLVICKRLKLGVPVTWDRSSLSGGGRPHLVLTVTLNRDGSVTASCHRRRR
jgi:hypothetical protein